MKTRIFHPAVFFFLLLSLFFSSKCFSYSVFTHEALIDASWESVIKPYLIFKYKDSDPGKLKRAKAFAYGGSIVPDMGYYPFGSRFFTDLLHYTRSGDFVETLIAEAQNMEEMAFALGVFAHYNADNYGHPLGTNKIVPIMFPKLKRKFGDNISYYTHPTSHRRVEFSFDVFEIAKGNYAPEAYHDFIGFEISKPVLERAFLKTYGLEIKDIFINLDLAISTFRWTVREIFPSLTKAAWASNKEEIEKNKPGITSKQFVYKMNSAEYKKLYKKPSFGAYVFSFFLKITPKIGPLKSIKFKAPNPESEKLFIRSFEITMKNYAIGIQNIKEGNSSFTNRDSDTGSQTEQCEYPLADGAYNKLLLKNSSNDFKNIDPSLKNNILAYYSPGKICEVKGKKKQRKISKSLERLKQK